MSRLTYTILSFFQLCVILHNVSSAPTRTNESKDEEWSVGHRLVKRNLRPDGPFLALGEKDAKEFLSKNPEFQNQFKPDSQVIICQPEQGGQKGMLNIVGKLLNDERLIELFCNNVKILDKVEILKYKGGTTNTYTIGARSLDPETSSWVYTNRKAGKSLDKIKSLFKKNGDDFKIKDWIDKKGQDIKNKDWIDTKGKDFKIKDWIHKKGNDFKFKIEDLKRKLDNKKKRIE